jgi:hypothetical protein
MFKLSMLIPWLKYAKYYVSEIVNISQVMLAIGYPVSNIQRCIRCIEVGNVGMVGTVWGNVEMWCV